jgi:hypothetical protein
MTMRSSSIHRKLPFSRLAGQLAGRVRASATSYPTRYTLALLALLLTVQTSAAPAPARRAPATSSAGGGDGFVSLFDGRTLGKWDGDPRFWSVRDGFITGETTKDNPARSNTFLVWRGGDVTDFELRLSVRITGNNSGIQYRSREAAKWVVHGYQCDIGEGTSERGSHYGKLSWEGGGRDTPLCPAGKKVAIHTDGKRETLADVGDAEAVRAGMNEGEWYDFEVIARGPHLIHKINGKVVVDATDEEQGLRAASGILALQIHGGVPTNVQFKNVRLKVLSPPPPSTRPGRGGV